VILPPLWVAWILALPVMDAMGQFIRRITQGHHPFYPDRGHLHLLLVDAGWSVPRTVYNLIALCALYIMTGGIAIYLSVMNWLFMGLWLVVFVGHVFVALKPYRLTNFIEKHK
jgi:UDP-GlcNAc:undecaprenyl-phosphate GlcNAc-1-phosphate transferase